MKKTIQTLSTISLAIAAFSMLMAVGFLTVLWEPLCSRFGYPSSAMEMGPILPLGVTASMAVGLASSLIVYLCAKEGTAIAGEIVSIILLSIVSPAAARILAYFQSILINKFNGSDAIVALTLTGNLINYAQGLMNISSALCLVVCGMSISEKLRQRKTL